MSGTLKKFKDPNEGDGESFPKFIKTPSDGEAGEGARLEFRCTVEGSPFPKVSWKKGQWLQLDDGGRYEVKRNMETGVCSMAIKATRLSDLGKYKVVAMNDFGEFTVPFSVKISADKKNGAESVQNFKTKLKHREVKQKVKKTPEEREREVLEILKAADPKDYEKICLEHGFYDFRMILHKLQAMKKVDVPKAEFEAVKVLKGLRHVTINDEGTAVFEMHMENVSPDKHMMWFKDGELLQVPGNEKRHELRRIGNVFQLIIRNATADDAGTYTLDIGGERFDAVLTVKEQPLRFDTELKNQSAKMRGRCVFECVTSRRGQNITWMKDGQIINMRSGLARLQAVTEGKSHKLIITELEMNDTGKYTAKLGDLESSAELSVSVAAIRFRQRLVGTEVKERSTATFECSVSSKDVVPVWTVNGEEVKAGDSRFTIKSGDVHSLSFKKVMLSDDKAKVKIAFGDVTSSAELHVTAKPIKLVSKLHDVKCRAGKVAEFACEIDDLEADTQPQWFKDDKPIKASSKYEITKIRGRYILKVKNVQCADDGIYQFQIRGVRSEAHLNCQDPPTVDKALLEKLRKNPLKFKAGTKAKIQIPFSGSAATSIFWTNGRVTLVERGRMHMENSANAATLTVDDCQIKDSGVYELTIANESGDVTIEVPVKIVDKPHPPSGEIAITDVNANNVSMSWNPPIDQSVGVDEYVIEMKDKSGKWKKLGKVKGDQTNYTATGLKEGESYQFRVYSSNEEGQSEALESKPVTATAKEQPPYIDPKVIEALEKTPIVVKAGETATIKVPVKGNPPPSAAWYHDGEEILPVKHHRATKNSSANEVVLKIVKCQGSDSGVYEGRIFNNVGGIVVKTKITVLDVANFGNAKINFDKITPQEVAMSWSAPEQDGGSAVTSYIVEKSEVGKDNWEKVSEVKGTSFKTSSCKPGVEYKFRVRAVNAQGKSEPLVSPPVTCGAATVAPSVDEDLIKALQNNPLQFKAGQTGRIKIPIKGGHPPPTITWEKDGKPLQVDGKRVICDHSDEAHNAQACIHKCQRSDSGKYVCKIKNEAGEISVPVQVNVLDAPKPPGGPVEFSDVSSKGVTMSWKAPVDDGGCGVTHYVIEKKEANRKVWSSVGKTDGAATTFRANVPGGKTYSFRVRAVNEAGESESFESKPVTVKDPFDAPTPVSGDIECVTSTNESITIGWKPVESDGGSPVTGYYIEKRKKGSSIWSRCNSDKPCKDRQFKADGLKHEIEYEFRVIAVNAAGESDPSRASRPIVAREPVDPPGEPSDLELVDSSTSSLSFKWKGTNQNGGGDLLGYDIELRKEGTDTWVKYNENHISGTSYTVKGLEHNATYHVRIRSVNIGAYSRYYTYRGTFIAQEYNVAPGFELTSELETAIRDGFVINAGGTIRIHVPYHARPRPIVHWTKDSAEVDETVNITDVDGVAQLVIRNARGFHSGSYKVTIKNASGSKSLTFKIIVNDVPPPPEGPVKIVMTDSDISLSWRPPSHQGSHKVTKYTIQKRDARGRDWQPIIQNLTQCQYQITDLMKGRSYYLRIMAENDVGLSEPLHLKDMVYIKQRVEKVQIDEVTYDEKDLRQPPHVTVALKPRAVPEGVKVTLSCSISGKPYPTTRWFKDGRDVTEDKHYFKENVIGLCRLVLNKVKASDAGMYKIVAENAVGTASSEANLQVM